MSTHFIAMAGLRGYSPNCCEAFRSVGLAAAYLAAIHQLGVGRTRKLEKEHYLKLNFRPTSPIIEDDGNEYCEIRECDCDDPVQHCDSGVFGDDPN